MMPRCMPRPHRAMFRAASSAVFRSVRKILSRMKSGRRPNSSSTACGSTWRPITTTIPTCRRRTSSTALQFFDNAGKAHIDGFEAEVEVAPARGLTLSGSLSYTDFTYKTFVLVGVDVASVARPTYFSNWTGRAAATYNSPALSTGGPHLTGLLEARYRSSYYLTSTPEVNVLTGQNALEDVNHRPGYWLVNGRIGLADLAIGGTRATLSAFGDNLLRQTLYQFRRTRTAADRNVRSWPDIWRRAGGAFLDLYGARRWLALIGRSMNRKLGRDGVQNHPGHFLCH